MPADYTIIAILLGLIILFLVSLFIIVKKGVSGLKLMLLGINMTLVGGIVALDSSLSFSGFGYLIVVVGIILSFIGSGKTN